MFCVDRVDSNYLVHSYKLDGGSHITHHNLVSLLVLFLLFFLTSVSGVYLKYGSTNLSDPQPNVTLTVGATNERVYCIQATGPVPTSMEWYNPQGQLVSRNNRDEVNQAGSSRRAATLTFQSYQRSQGGKYECRVAGPGNNSKRLAVCIGERYTYVCIDCQACKLQ